MGTKYIPTGLPLSHILHMLSKEESERYYSLDSRQRQGEVLSKEEQKELNVLTEKQNECARRNIEDDGEHTEGELV